MSRDSAIDRAIEDCIGQELLKDFLEEHSSEVKNMLFHKWNWDEALEVRFEEGEARGVAIGEARGEAKGVAIGEARGVKKGITIGEAKVLDLMAKGYSLEQIKKILRDKR
jgi:hypothetical protein